MKFLLLLFLLPGVYGVAISQSAAINCYPLPALYQASTEYTLEVNGKSVPVVHYNKHYDYAGFAMGMGTAGITVTITRPGSEVTAWRISPQKLQILAVKAGNQLRFTLTGDAYLIVKINDVKELVIMADREEDNRPEATGKGIFNITSFPYNAGGAALATRAVQQAIDDASAYKNGVVYIPNGVYTVGNLILKSNIHLYLEPGAVLVFSGKHADYKVHAHKISQRRDITWWIATDSGAHDIRISGRGTLDGNGKYAVDSGNIGNHILVVMKASRFTLDGPVIRNSGAWGTIIARSEQVRFSHFKLLNRLDMGENDGVDVMESSDVELNNGIGIALDDPFSAKTWQQNVDLCRNWPGRPRAQDNVRFQNLISWTYCYAYKIGQGVMQPQTNISFSNCVVYDAAVGIGIHHKWGTASIKHVIFDGIDVERLSYKNDDHNTWCVLYLQNGDKKGSGPVSDIKIRNVRLSDAGKSPGKIKGAGRRSTVSDVFFQNIQLPSGMYAGNLAEMNISDTVYCRRINMSVTQLL